MPLSTQASGPDAWSAAAWEPRIPAIVDATTGAARAELARLVAATPEAPYHAALGLTDATVLRVQAAHGAVGSPLYDRRVTLDLDLRLGEPGLDHTRPLPDELLLDAGHAAASLPLDGGARATRVAVWKAWERASRGAREQLARVRAVPPEELPPGPDFDAEVPGTVDLVPVPPLEVDLEPLRAGLAAQSRAFLDAPGLLDSHVGLRVERAVRTTLTTGGTEVRDVARVVRWTAWVAVRTPDGRRLEGADAVQGETLGDLPPSEVLRARVEALVARVGAEAAAPEVAPEAAPAVLEARAAAVFFHEILGHRLEGRRGAGDRTFADRLGVAILPPFLDVVDDPTRTRWGDEPLGGHYRYDDEGVPARSVTLVEGGVLRGLLTSRTPVSGGLASNGHGRRQAGSAPAPRQGNLLVLARAPVSSARLRALLVERLQATGQPWGYRVGDIEGGATRTSGDGAQVFHVRPLELWRVHADGRPDERVRAMDLVGTPLVTFGRILAAGDDPAVFNGWCGAESGWVPVSAVAPSLLFSELEFQHRESPLAPAPLHPPPLP